MVRNSIESNVNERERVIGSNSVKERVLLACLHPLPACVKPDITHMQILIANCLVNLNIEREYRQSPSSRSMSLDFHIPTVNNSTYIIIF